MNEMDVEVSPTLLKFTLKVSTAMATAVALRFDQVVVGLSGGITGGSDEHARGFTTFTRQCRQKPGYDLKNVHYNLEFSKLKLIKFAWLDPRSRINCQTRT